MTRILKPMIFLTFIFFVTVYSVSVQVSFDPASGQKFNCRNEAGNHWVRELDQVQLREVEGIHISASG